VQQGVDLIDQAIAQLVNGYKIIEENQGVAESKYEFTIHIKSG
jgi:hypothetical protein